MSLSNNKFNLYWLCCNNLIRENLSKSESVEPCILHIGHQAFVLGTIR